MTDNNADVKSWLSSLKWTLTQADPPRVDVDSLGRKSFKDGSYSARKDGTSYDVTMPSLERLLTSINSWEASQRPGDAQGRVRGEPA